MDLKSWQFPGSDKVKLETKTRIKSIPSNESFTDFPVLLQLTAPLQCKQRPGVDLVAVLDISSSMRGNRLKSMKQATLFVIDNLGPNDRMSIVSFDNKAQRRTGLSFMSDENLTIARTEVNKLQVGRGTNMGAGMAEAATILGQRTAEESSSRTERIIFLSDGEDNKIFSQHISDKFPAETIGLGTDHDPTVMRYIAEETMGVYSYVDQDPVKMKHAFAQSIGGLTSVTTMDLQIKLETQDGVIISSIESGDYRRSIGSNKQTGTIQINDLYAGEKKNFIVFLGIPEGKKMLMTVSGSYQNPKEGSKEARIQLGESKVAIVRPEASTPSDEAVELEVAAELARLGLVKAVSAMAKEGHLDENELRRSWNKIKGSEDGRMATKSTMSDLDKDVAKMQTESKTLAFMLSWLTSHLWQRATTKGAPSESGAFQTPAMTAMIGKADIPESKQESEGQARKGSKSNSYCCALSSVVILLLTTFLLRRYVVTPANETTTGVVITEPTPTVVVLPVDVNEGNASEDSNSSSNLLDLPGWPQFEAALEATMGKEMKDAGITSLLRGASAEYLRNATSRYLYLAIVHASVLGSRYKSEDVSRLQKKVKELEDENNKLHAEVDAHVKEENYAACNCKDSEDALDRAETPIEELPLQRAFTDSPV